MDGFSRIFLLISFLFLVLLNDKTITQIKINKSLLKISTDITADYCRKNHSLDFDVKESYKYITDEARYDLCKAEYNGFDPDGLIAQEYKQCLGPKYMYQTYYNPCEVVCPFRPDMLLKEFIYLEDIEELKCGEFFKTYSNVSRLFRMRNTDQECGPQHSCNLLGCCAKRVVTAPTTTIKVEPTQPSTPSTKIETTTHSATIAVSTQGTTRTTEATLPTITSTLGPTTELIAPDMSCNINNIGKLYKYPNDPTNRKYYRCVLKAELMACPLNQVFDKNLSHCKQIETTPTTLSTTITTTKAPDIDWSKYFHCTVEGHFRNPYDCKKFYWCYKNKGDNIHIWFSSFDCPPNQYFDEPQETCIRISDYIRERGVCKVLPLPTLPSKF